jgi:hypothetical protein
VCKGSPPLFPLCVRGLLDFDSMHLARISVCTLKLSISHAENESVFKKKSFFLFVVVHFCVINCVTYKTELEEKRILFPSLSFFKIAVIDKK